MSGETKTVIKGNSSKYVKLNVGGSLHYTTIGTLTKQDTMLRAMFSGRMEVLTDSEGITSIFVNALRCEGLKALFSCFTLTFSVIIILRPIHFDYMGLL